VHRLLLAGLAAALFLGGWSLPGVSAAQQDARPGLELAGALLFLTKVAALVVTAAWARRVAPPRAIAEASRRSTPGQLALSAAALLGTEGWTVWSSVGAVQPLVSPVLVVVSTVAVAALAHRLRDGLRSPAADGHVSPFL
jgi:hypothetical protein